MLEWSRRWLYQSTQRWRARRRRSSVRPVVQDPGADAVDRLCHRPDRRGRHLGTTGVLSRRLRPPGRADQRRRDSCRDSCPARRPERSTGRHARRRHRWCDAWDDRHMGNPRGTGPGQYCRRVDLDHARPTSPHSHPKLTVPFNVARHTHPRFKRLTMCMASSTKVRRTATGREDEPRGFAGSADEPAILLGRASLVVQLVLHRAC